jgi:manganese/zinc/iron transport system permease protein
MEIVWPGEGKWVPGLLVGAAAAGLCGMVCTVAIRRWTRVKEDAALAIVLSIFFGWGVVMFTVIQKLPTGNAAGINHFIFGKAASMIASDVRLIGVGSAIILAVALALFKELRLLCFDERFARTQGWPAMRLDMLLMGLVVAVTVIGLQSVGLLLVVAMLIIPAAAARFWSDHLSRLTAIAASIGGASAIIGVVLSALFPRLAAGAVIVLSGTVLFLVSMFFGSRRGVVRRLIAFRRLQLRTEHQHVLRAIFEHLEQASEKPSIAVAFSIDDLIPLRSWSRRDVQRQARRLQRDGLLAGHELEWRLTAAGLRRSEQVVRNHRLWELYLIQYADIAPSHVDRDADQIEHLLEPNLIAELELLLAPSGAVPSSPHALGEEGI